jgi:hypothetical protein
MRTSLLPRHRSFFGQLTSKSPLLLLATLVGAGCSNSGLSSPRTDGSLSDVPVGTGGSIPDGLGGAGGNGLDAPDDGVGDPPWATVLVSAALLNFGTVDVGTTSAAQVVTVTVSRPVTLPPTIYGAGFALSGTTCVTPQPVDVCTVSVVFAPVVVGAATGSLAVGSAIVALSGNGVAGSFSVTEKIDLGTLLINQAAPVSIQVNTSSASPMTCVGSSGNLSLASQTCPTSGAITAPCDFTFTFKASTPGVKNEAVVCTAGGKVTQTIVTATVVTGASPVINPPTASFVTSVGTSTVTTFTLANTGDSPTGELTVVTTPGGSPFSIVSNECTAPIAPLANCRIQVAFKPSAAGATTGTLTVIDNTNGQSSTAALTGTAMTGGPSTTISPATQDFGSVTVGTNKTLPFTVKNRGGIALDFFDLYVGGSDFIIDGQTCKGVALAPASQCTFTVTFVPKAPPGAKTAAIILTVAGVAMATVEVIGTAVDAVIDAGTDTGTPDAPPAHAACFQCGKFAATPVGQTSPEVTCTGQAAPPDGGIATMNVQLYGRDFAIVSESCTAAKCTVTLVFKPTVQGRQVGTLSAVNMDVQAACGVDFEATGL